MSKSFTYTRLSKENASLLLVDHQAGLISLVQDFSPSEFKNNILALAACGFFERIAIFSRDIFCRLTCTSPTVFIELTIQFLSKKMSRKAQASQHV